ncbi:MAG: hypothetical protein HPM95_06540 [Alphaproteobacteria bacterium]|nr:hypothetical protein [Alphaproteobacteria bacterium]
MTRLARTPRPQGRARPAAVARGRQDPAEGIGEIARARRIFKRFFAETRCARPATGFTSVRPGIEITTWRARRRRRRLITPGISRSPFRPGKSANPGAATAIASSSSRNWCRAAPCAGRDPVARTRPSVESIW